MFFTPTLSFLMMKYCVSVLVTPSALLALNLYSTSGSMSLQVYVCLKFAVYGFVWLYPGGTVVFPICSHVSPAVCLFHAYTSIPLSLWSDVCTEKLYVWFHPPVVGVTVSFSSIGVYEKVFIFMNRIEHYYNLIL